MRKIQWRQFANFRQTVNLAGINYVFQVKWNSSYRYWTLDIFDINNNPITFGLKIVIGTELLTRYVNPLLPRGVLFASGNKERIEREDMGEFVDLTFVSHEDLGEFI